VRTRFIATRLLAIILAGMWAAAGGLLLIWYRPGGPADLLVGICALVPLGIAAAAVAWPPVVRGPASYRVIVGLAAATGIVLIPTIGAMGQQLMGHGLQTLLPSPEAAYPWALAILGTSLFTAIGLSRRILGAEASRTRRLTVAAGGGLLLAAVSGGLIASVAIANDLTLASTPAGASRFGPTDPNLALPHCDDAPAAGPSASLELQLSGTIDRASIGGARVRGVRSGSDFRWSADVATVSALGLAGAVRLGSNAWLRDPGAGWNPANPAQIDGQSLDLAVVDFALSPAQVASAEELGTAYVEGAHARHCRVAVDGATFRRAFPEVNWLAGNADLSPWRGEVEYWLFADDQVGDVVAWLEGAGFAIREGAIQGRLDALLTATYRGGSFTISAPGN